MLEVQKAVGVIVIVCIRRLSQEEDWGQDCVLGVGARTLDCRARPIVSVVCNVCVMFVKVPVSVPRSQASLVSLSPDVSPHLSPSPQHSHSSLLYSIPLSTQIMHFGFSCQWSHSFGHFSSIKTEYKVNKWSWSDTPFSNKLMKGPYLALALNASLSAWIWFLFSFLCNGVGPQTICWVCMSSGVSCPE